MSTPTRDELFEALLSALHTLGPTLTPAVAAAQITEWDGDDPTFNEEAAFPSIQVAYSGGPIEPRQQVRGSAYARVSVFSVFVSTQWDAVAGSAGKQARQLLEGLEQGLQGPLGDTGRAVKRLGEETLVSAYRRRATYGQRYAVETHFHKTW